MMKIYYSHRPKLGVSIGVTEHENKFIIAGAFCNNGMSRTQKLKQQPDRFSRPMARKILKNRLIKATKEDTPYTYGVLKNKPLGNFMHDLRGEFKPKPLEDTQDDLFSCSNVNAIWENIINIVKSCQ